MSFTIAHYTSGPGRFEPPSRLHRHEGLNLNVAVPGSEGPQVVGIAGQDDRAAQANGGDDATSVSPTRWLPSCPDTLMPGR